MAIVLALPKLYDDVSARFEEEAPGAVAFFWGQRESQKHKLTAKRIVFIPGDDGDLGEIRAPRGPGANPYSSGPDFTIPDIGRPLANLAELFTVRIETYDISNGENERVQYEAVRQLYDAWYRAVYLAAHGNFSIVSQQYDDEYNNRRHGMALVVVCTVLAVIPDNAELVLTPPPANANIATSVEDVTEQTVTLGQYDPRDAFGSDLLSWHREVYSPGRWVDLTGNERHALQDTLLNQPQFTSRAGQRAILFEGNDWLRWASGVTGMPYTTLLIVEPSRVDLTQFVYSDNDGVGTSNSLALLATGPQWNMNSGPSASGGIPSTAIRALLAQWGTDGKLFDNDFRDDEEVISGDFGILSSDGFTLGASVAGGTNFFGWIWEMLVIGRELTEDERTAFAEYANDRYSGLSIVI